MAAPGDKLVEIDLPPPVRAKVLRAARRHRVSPNRMLTLIARRARLPTPARARLEVASHSVFGVVLYNGRVVGVAVDIPPATNALGHEVEPNGILVDWDPHFALRLEGDA